MHHSNDRKRTARVLGTYLDESGTNVSSPVAVIIAGLLLNCDSFNWLDVA